MSKEFSSMETVRSFSKKHIVFRKRLQNLKCFFMLPLVVSMLLGIFGCANQKTENSSIDTFADNINALVDRDKQGKLELIILEDMPDLGGIKLDKMLGTDFDGQKFFYQRYTTLQRRIRDALLKQAEANGFSIRLLEDNSLYNRFKTKNGTLVGVYFDPMENGFRIDKQLLNAIKANNPNTLVLQYRIDSLIFIPDAMEYRITMSLNLKDLKSNITRHVGTLRNKQRATSKNQEIVMDELAALTENTINNLMKKENAGSKLKTLALTMKTSSSMSKQPITLNINAVTFDPAVRKRIMYQIRSELIKKGLTTKARISSSDTTMTVEILPDKCNDSEELYFEYISPLLERIGITLDDNKVHYDNRNILLIQLDSRVAESKQPSFAKTDAKKLRIAVLYFENNTGKPENAPLSKGLCDMMINDMAQSHVIEVVERARLEEILKELKMNENDAFDQSKSAEIGKLLGVQYLVFGSYFQMLSKFRIDARIVRVETGKICVSAGYMGKADEFDTIEQKVVKGLLKGVAPNDTDTRNTSEPTKISANAVVKFGQALILIDKGQTQEAKTILQQLVNENPSYSEAKKMLKRMK